MTNKATSNKNQVLIHVHDEAKKKTMDFRCDKTLLLNQMKYFEKYLVDQDVDDLDDIDIAVHCDVSIFDWLRRYVHGLEPEMLFKSAVSILISSEFLQMDELVEKSLIFVSENL